MNSFILQAVSFFHCSYSHYYCLIISLLSISHHVRSCSEKRYDRPLKTVFGSQFRIPLGGHNTVPLTCERCDQTESNAKVTTNDFFFFHPYLYSMLFYDVLYQTSFRMIVFSAPYSAYFLLPHIIILILFTFFI